MITLKSVTSTPETDPMLRSTGGELRPTLWISLEQEAAGVSMDSYAPGAGTPADEWHGRTITASLATDDGIPDENDLREYLADDGMALLNRVYAGGSIDWDGSNHIGHINDDAEDALAELLDDIAALPRCSLAIWACEDWFGPCSDAELDITPDTTDEEIAALAESYESHALHDDAILADDVADYLTDRRSHARDAAL